MDTKFSVALHLLTMISESQDALTSGFLADSVGTNPSYVRKVIALLKKADLIKSRQGKSGYELGRSATRISLLDIYLATQEQDRVRLFDRHQHSNPSCPVGAYIEQGLTPVFEELEANLAKDLASRHLQGFIDQLYRLREKGENDESSPLNQIR
ncbi:Rrf2 family transcriptional regulator [Streptococcus cuniculipharyngis]|uniref:Rrf2 family transcriptional regulator n=1 Tax=Streptococcus cuniculipharyngis TaxID=1562651 RepID=A0A5C5SAC5_9STRE|nr:Rrf2 family transcriptional regulator [Streptococcus cuniculipharyngis]TWS96191.1 Rrf2 family transcriptional regulator [Streptococcus cuniculipharyngis]